MSKTVLAAAFVSDASCDTIMFSARDMTEHVVDHTVTSTDVENNRQLAKKTALVNKFWEVNASEWFSLITEK